MLNIIIKLASLIIYLTLLLISVIEHVNILIVWMIFVTGLGIILGTRFIDYETPYRIYKENKESLKLMKKWEEQSKTVIKFVEDYVKDKRV